MNSKMYTEQLLDFIHESPTCYHTIANAAALLEKNQYLPLSEKEEFALKEGGRYYLTRNDSSLIAFELPKCPMKAFALIAAHSDAPGFKVKEKPEIGVEDSYLVLNTEKYGGAILSTWLDRPLVLAGRVVIRTGQGLESRLVCLKDRPCIIPNLAIHLNREINKGVEYNAQTELRPLFSGNKDLKLVQLLARELKVEEETILGTDLFVINPQKGMLMGAEEEFAGSPRLDDTQCVFAALQGFLQAECGERAKVYCVFDHEEVGSRTRQGADSDFLALTLERIAAALGREKEYPMLLANSLLLSADNGHGLHPNYVSKSDPTNRPVLNGGIVIKYHGSQQYTTDAFTGAMVKDICIRENIPYQTYHNRSDIAGGSTLGNISISHVSIPSADVGLAQLAMHSSFETGGAKDTEYMVRLARAFYEVENR